MATAKRVQPPPAPPSTVVLELSEREASVLKTLVGSIGANVWENSDRFIYNPHKWVSKETRLSEINSIYKALHSVVSDPKY